MERENDGVRLLLVSPLPPPAGGIATWTRILCDETATRCDVRLRHVDTAVRWRRPGDLAGVLRGIGGSLQAARDLARVGWALAASRPDVLHLTSSAGWAAPRDVLMLLLARSFGAAGLLHYRTSRVAHRGSATARAERLAMRLARRVVVVDEATRSRLAPMLPASKLRAIPNMVDLGAIDAWRAGAAGALARRERPERTELVFAGLVVREKGVTELIEACAGVAGVELHLVGPVEAAYREEIEGRGRAREEGRWLHVHGGVTPEEVWRRIALADIALLPSRVEAFPNALLEAMALATPVVVTDVGAMAEMIDARGVEACGLCVEPGSAPSLQAGIEDLVARREQWPVLGANARRRAERLYSTRPVTRSLVACWRELAGARA